MASVPTPATVSLYVGDLDPEITETQLYNLFSTAGPIASIRVCKDIVSRRSLGYAYVNYNVSQDESAGIRALESLNYTILNGKAIRIMWSNRDPSIRKSGLGNLFVKGLDESIGTKELHEMFSSLGKILSCKVSMQDGASRGYGFVQYESEDSANDAIEKMNGTTKNGKRLYVGKFIKKSERTSPSAEVKFTNLYVKNIDVDITEDVLQSKFAEFGKITNVLIMKDEDGKSKGFGFINFESSDDARKAADAMNGSIFGSKSIFVGRAQKKSEREQMLRRQFEEKRLERIQKFQGLNLYVKNLDEAIDDEYLRRHFANYGTIVSAKVMLNERGISKGFGFVCFSSPEEATKAVAEHGSMLFGKPIYVAIAQRKEVRRAQLEQQFAQRMAGVSGPPGTIMPPPYAPLYFTGPPGVVSPYPQRQGVMYSMGVRPGWRPAGMPNPIAGRQGFQPMAPLPVVPAGPRHQRQMRGRANGQAYSQANGPLPVILPPHQQAQLQPVAAFHDNARNQQNRSRQTSKFAFNGRGHELQVNGVAQASAVPSGLASPPTPAAAVAAANTIPNNLAEWSSLLANAPAQQQKQMLGERLFPLVQQLQYNLAGKITGMLLEMDNSELLLLLESPEALALKVEEAVLVLQQHTKAGHDSPEPLAPAAGQQVAEG